MEENGQITQTIYKEVACWQNYPDTVGLSWTRETESEGRTPRPQSGGLSAEARGKNHSSSFPGLETKWDFPDGFQSRLRLVDFFFFLPLSPVLSRNVYKCCPLSAPYCVFGAGKMVLELDRFTDGEDVWLRMEYTQCLIYTCFRWCRCQDVSWWDLDLGFMLCCVDTCGPPWGGVMYFSCGMDLNLGGPQVGPCWEE